MLQAFEQVQQIGLNVPRRFADEAGNLGDRQRVVQQQRDKIFTEHEQSEAQTPFKRERKGWAFCL